MSVAALSIDSPMQDKAQYTFTFSPATSNVISGDINPLAVASLQQVKNPSISATRAADFVFKFQAQFDLTFTYDNSNGDDDTVGQLANKMIALFGSAWFGTTQFISATGGSSGYAASIPDVANELVPGLGVAVSGLADDVSGSLGSYFYIAIGLAVVVLFFYAGGGKFLKGSLA